jgi:peptidyl-prolyl cis-trans isomerase A (cyclophilin A)
LTIKTPRAQILRVVIILVLALAATSPVLASSVTLQTVLGDVVIELYDDETPETVANFLNYVRDGDYNSSFIHRRVNDFIIQGGGFTYIDDSVDPVPKDPSVINEPGISNLRGTIAMAKVPGDANSATSQWFINLGDNSENLDSQNGGFTVFGEVAGDGMEVVDAIAALPTVNAGEAFTDLPVIDFSSGDTIQEENLVLMDVIENSEFVINQGLNDTWYNIETNGQGFFIIVYPSIKTMFLTWFTYDTVRPDESTPFMLGEPGHRWLTAQGNYDGNRAELTITMTRGGIFDSGVPTPVSTADGTIMVEFADCKAGTVSYNIPSIDSQGIVPIQRVVADNIALCEELAELIAQ